MNNESKVKIVGFKMKVYGHIIGFTWPFKSSDINTWENNLFLIYFISTFLNFTFKKKLIV